MGMDIDVFVSYGVVVASDEDEFPEWLEKLRDEEEGGFDESHPIFYGDEVPVVYKWAGAYDNKYHLLIIPGTTTSTEWGIPEAIEYTTANSVLADKERAARSYMKFEFDVDLEPMKWLLYGRVW